MAAPLNVLIVEDSEDDAVLLVQELIQAGYGVNWKRVETEADYLASLGPHLDLVFSDFSLPQFSTVRALEILRRSQMDIPFVIVSGTIGEERAVESLKAGATDYVLKDRLKRLAPVVHRALQESRQHADRRRAEEALRASEERFRELAENIHEVFWITDPAKREMLYISPAFEKIWGRSRESLLRAPGSWMDAIHAQDRDRVLQAVVTRQCEGTYDEQYRIVQPGGSTRWIHDRAFPVRDAFGEVVRIVGVAEDVTRRKELEAQFLQSQKMDVFGQLSAGVAHDFNNMLTVIHWHCHLLEEADHLPKELQDSVQQIQEAAGRATKLTRQMLMFCRRSVMQACPLNLNEVADSLLSMLARVIGENIELEFKPGTPIPGIQADPIMLDQAVLNLVVNARDAMPKGGVLTLATSSAEFDEAGARLHPGRRPGLFVCLTVADTGCGMDDATLVRLFEPFFTTKEPGKGTGLGLATVYGILQQHDGWVEVSSAPGVGSIFRLYLPAIGAPVAAPVSRPAGKSERGGNETILLVEDEPAVRASLSFFLRRWGYRVLEACDGDEACELWRQHRGEIALLHTDMVLPAGVTGLELARKMRQDRPGLQVILSSGYSEELIAPGCLDAQNITFLAKPCMPDTLASVVRRCLDAARA